MEGLDEGCELESFFGCSFDDFYPLIRPMEFAHSSLLDRGCDKGLCAGCRSLNICGKIAERAEVPTDGRFYIDISAHPGLASVASLRESAKSCSLCEFLWTRAERNVRKAMNCYKSPLDLSQWSEGFETLCQVYRDTDDASSVTMALWVITKRASYDLYPQGIQFTLGGYELQPFKMCITEDNKSAPPSAWLMEPDPLLSDSLWLKVERWLLDCRQHSQCTVNPSILPDRFIDLNLREIGLSRLRRADGTQTGRYVALSYCWGENNLYTLTTSSLASMQERIDEVAMPKTLQDTFALCRRLQIQFLWIDALCILQDDSQDWAEQSAKMDQVYGNAYLTVCATNSSSAAAGFLGRRSPSHHLLGTTQHSGQRYPVYMTDHMHSKSLRRLFFSGVGGGGQLQHEPLVHRAWTIQERMLSPRTLHFGSFRAIWACRECTRTEDGIQGDPQTDELAAMTPNNACYKWWSLVEYYSACKITRETDCLPALSGIASQAAKIIQDEYIAGNWRGNLFDCMHWSIRHEKATRRNIYVAPSWSWASVRGGVSGGRFSGPPSVHIAKVLSTNTVLAGSDQFGAIVDCEVVMHAPYIVGVLTFEERDLWNWAWPGHKSKLDTGSRCLELEVWIDEPQRMIDQAGTRLDQKAVNVGLLVTMRQVDRHHDPKRPPRVSLEEHPQYWPYCGLIVASVSGDTPNRFKRLGIFECHQNMHLLPSSLREVVVV